MLEIVCPDCLTVMKAPDTAAGRSLSCSRCGRRIIVAAVDDGSGNITEIIPRRPVLPTPPPPAEPVDVYDADADFVRRTPVASNYRGDPAVWAIYNAIRWLIVIGCLVIGFVCGGCICWDAKMRDMEYRNRWSGFDAAPAKPSP